MRTSARWPLIFVIILLLSVACTQPEATLAATPTLMPTPIPSIAFFSDRDGNWEIYVTKADGTNQTRLTDNAGRDGSPAWSPDGSKIAFHSRRDCNAEIYVMNADGTNQTRVTNNPAIDARPAWSFGLDSQ